MKSIAAAEILRPAIFAIDEAKIIAAAYSTVLNMNDDVIVCVDSKFLFDSLYICHSPTEQSIRTDVAVIR